MRKLIRYENENKQQFIERVNAVMMDDFASEFMKTEDNKMELRVFSTFSGIGMQERGVLECRNVRD